MNKKTLLLASFCFVASLLLSSVPAASATFPKGIPNINELIIASTGIPETVDPHWAYDEISLELIRNVYDTLIGFDWEDPGTFTPKLATAWYTATPEPGYAMKVVFEMRDTGVTWHNGHVSDGVDLAKHAEYSIERWMYFDRSGGPTWMIFEALFGPGYYSVWDLPDPTNDVKNAVKETATRSSSTSRPHTH